MAPEGVQNREEEEIRSGPTPEEMDMLRPESSAKEETCLSRWREAVAPKVVLPQGAGEPR